MTCYVNEFFAKSFEDSQAWALIISCKGVKLNHLVLQYKEHMYWIDNESITTTQTSYLLSLRFTYLSLRKGNHWVIQLYYPRRFCRQFGHPQDVPRGLLEVFRTRTLEVVYKHWKSCTRLGTHSKITMPNYHSLDEFSITKAYADWWIGMCNLEKNMLTITCIEPPHVLLYKYPQNLWRVEHARSTQVFLLRAMLGTTLRETLIIYLMT